MRAIDRLRAAWSAITESRARTALAAAALIGAVAAGVGFSLAVNAIREPAAGQAPVASAEATVEPSASADATATLTPTPTPTAVPATAEPTASPTPAQVPQPTAVPTAVPSAVLTPRPLPTPAEATGECDEITMDSAGTVFVNDVAAADELESEYGEQMPMSILRLAARASGVQGASACLEVQLPAVVVTGELQICGDVVSQRLEPLPTPTPDEPGPSMPPRYGEPSIAGVSISNGMLDVHSYPVLDLADVANVQACLELTSQSNDVYLNYSLSICETALLADDGSLTLRVGDRELTLEPDYLFDEQAMLSVGKAADVGLIIRVYRDDVIHLVELAVWTMPDCS